MINNPLSTTYDGSADQRLIEAALGGSGQALEQLVRRHQHFIYNVALKMMLNPADAEDLTQEALIKMVTKLSQFQGRSNFRTWLYRITFNHFLNTKKNSMETAITSFEEYGHELDRVTDQTMTKEEEIAFKELITEARLSCMSGMLLCLNREQRLVYILGEIFNVDHKTGSEMLEITKANFRKRLERARRDLYQFMQNKCGLLNQANPCRCARKTKGFIEAGWVDKDRMKYNTNFLNDILDVVEKKDDVLSDLLEDRYKTLFQKTPFQEKEHRERLMRSVLMDKEVRKLFRLN
ncbi:MAG: sigma-70 family RNA polymerase sigma factor [Bacteroidota bacterium]